MDKFTIIFNVFGLTALVFIFLGTAFLFVGSLIKNSSKNWHKTDGIIVNEKAIFENLANTYPTARYSVDGVEYKHSSNIRQRPGIPTGKEVEIIYNPHNPSQARINTAVQNGSAFRILGIVFFSISVLPIIIGIILFIIL